METFSALLCEENSPVTGDFLSQSPATRSFDAFFDLHLNKQLSKQSRRQLFETQLRSLWRHCNEWHAYNFRLDWKSIVVIMWCQICRQWTDILSNCWCFCLKKNALRFIICSVTALLPDPEKDEFLTPWLMHPSTIIPGGQMSSAT